MPDVKLLFGPMLIGTFLNNILYGMLVVQSFIYYQTYKNDKKWIRYLILYLFLVETLNSALAMFTMYEPLVLRYGTEEGITNIPIMLLADPFVTVFISTPIQLFLAWRIKIISQSKVLTGIISFFAMSSFIGGIAAPIATKVTDSMTYDRLPRMAPGIITWLTSAATTDIIITVSLVYHLYRRKTGVRSTDDLVNRIMRLTIQTGMITALFATLDVICFNAFHQTSMNFAWDFPLCKLYTNSLLSTLNARAGWNNLVINDESNVLFGGDNNQSMMRRTDRTTTRSKTDHRKIVTGVYELGTASTSTRLGKDIDLEADQSAAVHVTKVIEHSVDPSQENTVRPQYTQ
ncbi:hypothetical protein PTI98_012146 [Pleurotus ostreatus]|uniref:DUF6534 domain-containing protein n=2 Tax=Pleurotus ostreatus TaxID=5322 RepID=A0A067N6P8_PLEO1|nr:hypothetical protein PTI98_012146 [Pleurotus ostreatus]KDQ23703.1 hypothetical protein PLEOSDRAFT_1108189 [Pleurotus ostreatus PC15]